MVVTTECVGLLGGSFNPVHIGHLMLASYLSQSTAMDSVWLVLSPLNPLKDSQQLLADDERLAMLEIATRGVEKIEVCDVELSMPRPSYTIDTLDLLARRYPSKRFKLIIGSDNWNIFEQWKAHERIIADYGVVVYPRPEYELAPVDIDGVEMLVDAPMFEVSSTSIRDALALGKNMDCFLPSGVGEYIREKCLYIPKKTIR